MITKNVKVFPKLSDDDDINNDDDHSDDENGTNDDGDVDIVDLCKRPREADSKCRCRRRPPKHCGSTTGEPLSSFPP